LASRPAGFVRLDRMMGREKFQKLYKFRQPQLFIAISANYEPKLEKGGPGRLPALCSP
jgi:hypothetical protein